jgi:predicted PurR-regulated permease PerM
MHQPVESSCTLQVVMGTFILTFVGRSLMMWLQDSAHLSDFIKSDDKRRRLLVVSYFITIAMILGVFGILTIPYIVREGADFISRLQAENIWCGQPASL